MPDGADDDDPTFDTANSTVARLRALQSSQEQRLKLTREELLRFETQLLWLVNSGIRLRYQRRGRWRKEDTARRTYVYTIALPNLRRGKLPPVLDWEFLFMDPGRPADEKSLLFRHLMKWANGVHPDPRSGASRPVQRTMLEFLTAWGTR